MRLQSAVRRIALVAVLLLVPTLAVLSFDRWPSQNALADSALLTDEAAVDSATPTATSAVTNDETITLKNWEDTDRPQKAKRSPKGKGKGKGPPDGVPPGPPDGVPPGPPDGIE